MERAFKLLSAGSTHPCGPLAYVTHFLAAQAPPPIVVVTDVRHWTVVATRKHPPSVTILAYLAAQAEVSRDSKRSNAHPLTTSSLPKHLNTQLHFLVRVAFHPTPLIHFQRFNLIASSNIFCSLPDKSIQPRAFSRGLVAMSPPDQNLVRLHYTPHL